MRDRILTKRVVEEKYSEDVSTAIQCNNPLDSEEASFVPLCVVSLMFINENSSNTVYHARVVNISYYFEKRD